MKLYFHGRMRRQMVLRGIVCLLTAALAGGAAGRETNARGGRSADEPVSLESIKSVLGMAGDYASGVVDLTRDESEIVIAYRFYDPDGENYETDFATELAPRIQALYKKFPGLNRIRLQVIANDDHNPGLWKPFVQLSFDRKTIEEIRWTGFLARYLLDETLKSRK